jgi:hypothetical protein
MLNQYLAKTERLKPKGCVIMMVLNYLFIKYLNPIAKGSAAAQELL